jgi:hypothetical protein
MPLYEMTPSEFHPISQSSFSDLKVRERNDLQRLLRTQISVLNDDLYVLTEEFEDWEDSRRRIDLLAIDREANLVVIELKRTSDGGDMELQAIRYASMISAMTFEGAEQIHAEFLKRLDQTGETARERMLTFLNWKEPDEEKFALDVRIILVSEDFGKELTTAVLWLREREIDIRCVRLRPYQHGNTCLIDVQQIIPLPEAHEYQVQLRRKEQGVRKKRAERHDLREKFWEGVVALARKLGTRHANIKPNTSPSLGAGAGIGGLRFHYGIGQDYAFVELYVDCGEEAENKRIFDHLHAKKDEIEKSFGDSLLWECGTWRASQITHEIKRGGYRNPESEWPQIQEEMVKTMARLETALKPALDELKL